MQRIYIQFYVMSILFFIFTFFIVGCAVESSYYIPSASTVTAITPDAARQQWANLQWNPTFSSCKTSGWDFIGRLSKDRDGLIFELSKGEVVRCTFEQMNPEVISSFGYYTVFLGQQCHCRVGVPRTDNPSGAVGLANILYVIKNDEKTRKAEMSSFIGFQQKAEAWRAMSIKPSLPEDVQRLRILAEDAFQNKEFKKAVDYYKKGLEIEPCWPDGQYNAAFLYGEIKDYERAVNYMKRYLELVPDAKDAKEAREKMYLWEGKAKEAGIK